MVFLGVEYFTSRYRNVVLSESGLVVVLDVKRIVRGNLVPVGNLNIVALCACVACHPPYLVDYAAMVGLLFRGRCVVGVLAGFSVVGQVGGKCGQFLGQDVDVALEALCDSADLLLDVVLGGIPVEVDTEPVVAQRKSATVIVVLVNLYGDGVVIADVDALTGLVCGHEFSDINHDFVLGSVGKADNQFNLFVAFVIGTAVNAVQRGIFDRCNDGIFFSIHKIKGRVPTIIIHLKANLGEKPAVLDCDDVLGVAVYLNIRAAIA